MPLKAKHSKYLFLIAALFNLAFANEFIIDSLKEVRIPVGSFLMGDGGGR